MHQLEDLEAWKKSREFRIEMSEVANSFPDHERYKLKDQLIRASRAIAANIAEGFGRFHYQENIQYCRQARGSLFECKEHMFCALDEKYINHDQLERFTLQFDRLLKILNGYIAYLKKAKTQ